MSGQSFQRGLRHGVYRERSSQGLDVENVGGLGIFGPCAGPQQTLRTTAEIVNTLPARRAEEAAGCLVCAFSDGDAQLIAQLLRYLAGNSGVPAADKHGCHGTYEGIEAGLDPPFNATQECLSRCEVLSAREQKSDVDGNAGKDGLLNRRKALLRARNLDEQVGTICAGEQLLGCSQGAGRVIGKQRGDFQRNPPIDPVRLFINWSKEIGGTGEVLNG